MVWYLKQYRNSSIQNVGKLLLKWLITFWQLSISYLILNTIIIQKGGVCVFCIRYVAHAPYFQYCMYKSDFMS